MVIETPQIWGGDTPWFNTTGEGQIVTLDGSKWPDSTGKVAKVTRYNTLGDGSDTDSLTSDGVAKLIYQLDNPGNLLSSFETYLNINQLVRNGYLVNPAPGDRFVLAIQNQADNFTKATGQVTAVPEPSSVVLAALGLGGLGLAYLRRRP